MTVSPCDGASKWSVKRMHSCVCYVSSIAALVICRCLLWCCISTMSSSLRVVSTVTTTARWEGTTTPMWPYLPATGCSKWTAEMCVTLAVCRIFLDTLISARIDSVLTVSLSLPLLVSLPGSGMFDDGLYMYLIEPLQQTHSIVSYSRHREAKYASY